MYRHRLWPYFLPCGNAVGGSGNGRGCIDTALSPTHVYLSVSLRWLTTGLKEIVLLWNPDRRLGERWRMYRHSSVPYSCVPECLIAIDGFLLVLVGLHFWLPVYGCINDRFACCCVVLPRAVSPFPVFERHAYTCPGVLSVIWTGSCSVHSRMTCSVPTAIWLILLVVICLSQRQLN